MNPVKFTGKSIVKLNLTAMKQKIAQSLYRGFPGNSGIQVSTLSLCNKRVYDGFPIEVEGGEKNTYISEHPKTKRLLRKVY